MTKHTDAVIRDRRIICSLCGSEMKAEQIWHEDNEMVPYLYWRCSSGHITQALPAPADVLDRALYQDIPATKR